MQADSNNIVFEDEIGRPGPVLGAIVYARDTSIAHSIESPWTTFPANPVTGELFGYQQKSSDARKPQQRNSGGIRAKFSAKFQRCRCASPSRRTLQSMML